jgi:hypothetical protein
MDLLKPEMNGIERSRGSDLSQIGIWRCWPLFAPWRTMAREETARLFVHKSLGLAYMCYFPSFELSFKEARI